MGDGQPENAPPVFWPIRTDAGARKVVERIDAVRAELAELSREVAVVKALQNGNVTFKNVLLGAAAILATMLGTFAAVIARAESLARDAGAPALVVAKETQQAQRQLELFVKVELQDFKRELKADMSDLKDEVRNTTRAVERAKPRRDAGQ